MTYDYFHWIVLPILIFIARFVDITIATLRIIFTLHGRKYLAPLLGFIEILIWLLAISQVFQNLNNPLCYIAYAAGFASGNFMGIILENKLAFGMRVVRIITRDDPEMLIKDIRASGYGLTVVDGEGKSGPVKILFTVIKRKDLNNLIKKIQNDHPNAFYSVEDVRLARDTLAISQSQERIGSIWQRFLSIRKAK